MDIEKANQCLSEPFLFSKEDRRKACIIAIKAIKVAEEVMNMPFGESCALPWCVESFPLLNNAILALKGEIDGY